VEEVVQMATSVIRIKQQRSASVRQKMEENVEILHLHVWEHANSVLCVKKLSIRGTLMVADATENLSSVVKIINVNPIRVYDENFFHCSTSMYWDFSGVDRFYC